MAGDYIDPGGWRIAFLSILSALRDYPAAGAPLLGLPFPLLCCVMLTAPLRMIGHLEVAGSALLAQEFGNLSPPQPKILWCWRLRLHVRPAT